MKYMIQFYNILYNGIMSSYDQNSNSLDLRPTSTPAHS